MIDEYENGILNEIDVNTEALYCQFISTLTVSSNTGNKNKKRKKDRPCVNDTNEE